MSIRFGKPGPLVNGIGVGVKAAAVSYLPEGIVIASYDPPWVIWVFEDEVDPATTLGQCQGLQVFYQFDGLWHLPTSMNPIQEGDNYIYLGYEDHANIQPEDSWQAIAPANLIVFAGNRRLTVPQYGTVNIS